MPIAAIGGVRDHRIVEFAVALADSARPKVLWVGTASAERPEAAQRASEAFGARGEVSHLNFFPWPPDDLRSVVLAHDVILVGGGNTANMLAVWRVHGFDDVLRDAWRHGKVLCGWSAGAICWFEAGVTDSFGPGLAGMDCLGFLRGSACPHYDGEALRRPRYAELIREGFPRGIAIDDDVAVVYDGTECVEVVSCREGATAYLVGAEGEQPLPARLL
jgi:dipeptidase E